MNVYLAINVKTRRCQIIVAAVVLRIIEDCQLTTATTQRSSAC